MRLLVIIIVTSLLIVTSQSTGIFKREIQTTTCGERRLRAADYPKPFTSPNFPRKFPDQTQCSWLIRSVPGTRVKISIQDFSLLSPDGGNTCIKQFVRFHDPYTNMFVGPFCGNSNIPPVVSSANELRVWLESNTVGIKGNYRGFKMTYRETTDPTSDSMKDPDKLYRKMNTAKPKQIVTMPTMVPTDNRVDRNNNDAIDAENQKLNEENSKRNNANENMEKLIKEMTKANLLRTQKAIYKTPAPSLTQRVLRQPKRRPIQPTAHSRPYIPPNLHMEQEEAEPTGMKTEAIAGVVCGLLVALAIGIFIFFKMRKTKDDKNKKTKSLPPPYEENLSGLPGIEKIPPPVKDEVKTIAEMKDKKEIPKQKKVDTKPVMNKKERDTLNVVKNEAILPQKRPRRNYEEITDVVQDKNAKNKSSKRKEEHLKSNRKSDLSKKVNDKINDKKRDNSRGKGNREKPRRPDKDKTRGDEKHKSSTKKIDDKIERLPRRAEKAEPNRDNKRRHRSHSAEKQKKNVHHESKKRSKSVTDKDGKSKTRKSTSAKKKDPKMRTNPSVKTNKTNGSSRTTQSSKHKTTNRGNHKRE